MAKKSTPAKRRLREAPKAPRAIVTPTRGLSGLLNGYSVLADGETVAAGLGFHVALGKARELNDPLETS